MSLIHHLKVSVYLLSPSLCCLSMRLREEAPKKMKPFPSKISFEISSLALSFMQSKLITQTEAWKWETAASHCKLKVKLAETLPREVWFFLCCLSHIRASVASRRMIHLKPFCYYFPFCFTKLSEWEWGAGGRVRAKNQVEILAENLLFQEMNGEKFFICGWVGGHWQWQLERREW